MSKAKNPETVGVGEEEPEQVEGRPETMAGSASPEGTKIENRQTPEDKKIEALNNTLGELKSLIETRREKGGSATAEIYKMARRDATERIIDSARDILGERTREQEAQFIANKKQEKWLEEIGKEPLKMGSDAEFLQTCRSKVVSGLDKDYKKSIEEDTTLSRGQKHDLTLYQPAEIAVGSFGRTIILGKEEIFFARQIGWDVNEIKTHFFSKEIEIGGRNFANLEEFNKAIAEEKEEYIAKKSQDTMNGYKNPFMESITDRVLADEMKKALEDIKEKKAIEKQERAEEEIKKAEERWNGLSSADKIKEIGEMRNLWLKAKKIDAAIKGEKVIKVEKDKKLDGSKEEDRKKLGTIEGGLSNQIINMARINFGIDFMARAKEAVSPFDENGVRIPDEIRQREIGAWVTKEIIKKYDEKRGSIKLEAGQKIKIKKRGKGPILAMAKPMKISQASILTAEPGVGFESVALDTSTADSDLAALQTITESESPAEMPDFISTSTTGQVVETLKVPEKPKPEEADFDTPETEAWENNANPSVEKVETKPESGLEVRDAENFEGLYAAIRATKSNNSEAVVNYIKDIKEATENLSADETEEFLRSNSLAKNALQISDGTTYRWKVKELLLREKQAK
ncbi:MAG: hypothetical protein ABSF55_01935 [Candidatus Staskawiczbacteria bacterium]|jgi:hypothetical protein